METVWPAFYKNNYQSVIETSLRSFQYQILTRTIPTNKFLARCNLANSDICWYCQENTETIEHLFWLCPVVKTFWFQLLDAIGASTEIRSSMKDKLCSWGADGPNKDTLNFIFTVVKKYVYNTKCKERSLNIDSCITLCKYLHRLEQCATSNNYGVKKAPLKNGQYWVLYFEYSRIITEILGSFWTPFHLKTKIVQKGREKRQLYLISTFVCFCVGLFFFFIIIPKNHIYTL